MTIQQSILTSHKHLGTRAAQVFVLLSWLLFVAEWFLASANLGTFGAVSYLRWTLIRMLTSLNLDMTLSLHRVASCRRNRRLLIVAVLYCLL